MAAPGKQDYKSLKPASGQKGHKEEVTSGETRDWWNKEGAKAAQTISGVVDLLQGAQTARIRQQVISSRQYGNQAFTGAAGLAYQRMLSSRAAIQSRQTYNATQEIIDTLVSRVGETKPRPYFQLSAGGNYKQHRKVQKLNQFVEGVFYETKTYTLGPEAFRDAAIWGDGFIYVFGRGGKIRHERVWGSELWVDEIEAQYGYPRNMHRVKEVDKDELAGYFPEHRVQIMKAAAANDNKRSRTTSDMVTVCESWHLGAMNEDGELVGGKHAITLVSQDFMLVEPEDWPYDFFPFARVSWCKRPIGYWSQGLCEQLQGDQIELNKEIQLVQRSMHLAGSFKVLIEAGSKVVKEHVNNEVGAIVEFTGKKPEYIIPAPIHPVYFQNIPTIIERMRNRAGVSQMAAHGTKPTGLNSGVAIREMDDIESERHRSIQVANNNLYMELAHLTVVMASEMAKQGKLDIVRRPGKASFNRIDWGKDIKEVELDEFTVQVCDVSRLPKDPAGRLAAIQEYIAAGWMNPREGRRALEFSEMDTWESLANAQEDIITKNLDLIVDEGEYNPPEPTDDLALCKELVVEYIQRFRLLALEDEKLDLLRTWNSQVDTMVKKGREVAALEGQAQTIAEQVNTAPAAPMPPPRSDLIPNVRNQGDGSKNPLS